MLSAPGAPQVEYAALIFEVKTESGQRISTTMSRGSDSIEIVSVCGSARSSISVSERDGVPSASPWRRS